MVIDIEVNKQTGDIVATHLYLAHNTGVTVSPELTASQVSAGAIMGLSRALCERVTFTEESVTSTDWLSYPILRSKQSPLVTIAIVHPNGYLTVTPGSLADSVTDGNVAAAGHGWGVSGAGEAASVPPSPAVANAFFDATGVRIRETPMTPTRVRSELKSAAQREENL
jgi:nicotinate dehydrogenase subunit B